MFDEHDDHSEKEVDAGTLGDEDEESEDDEEDLGKHGFRIEGEDEPSDML